MNNTNTNPKSFSFQIKCPDCRDSIMDISLDPISNEKQFVCIVNRNHIIKLDSCIIEE
jgi:hypothetical protein